MVSIHSYRKKLIGINNHEKIKQLIKKIPFLAFCAAILGKIIPGYLQYHKLIRKFGRNIIILRTAWHGTGDYYICGMYLQEYLRLNEISTYVFLVNAKGSEAKVTELFPVYEGHVLKMRSINCLSRFSEFMQLEKPLCKSFECSDHLTFIGEKLKGYRGLTLMDFYLYYGFGFKEKSSICRPRFSQDINRIRAMMKDKDLILGRTILLAPYSTCSKEYLPPVSFWEHLATYLHGLGYAVATNCFGKELPIEGTIPLSIAYTDIVPFLDEAGGFIGVRSGLCDIISQSSCHKIVMHLLHSDFWPRGRSEAFIGLCSMGFDREANEFTYSGNLDDALCEIVHFVNTWPLLKTENSGQV